MNVAFEDVAKEIMKMAAITACAFSVQWYVQTIVPFLSPACPTGWGNLVRPGGHANQPDRQFDRCYGANLKALIGAMKFDIFDASFSDIWLGIQAVVFYVLGGIPFLLAAVATLFVLKVSTTAIVAVGPLFIAFLLFDQTKQYFWGWVAAIAGFMLAQVLISVVLAIEIGFINTVMIKNGVIDTSLGESHHPDCLLHVHSTGRRTASASSLHHGWRSFGRRNWQQNFRIWCCKRHDSWCRRRPFQSAAVNASQQNLLTPRTHAFNSLASLATTGTPT
nr:type IV secretion system protein [Pseudomonas syringae]UVN17866.1 hypothetical protein pPsy0479a_00034 [Pseudomonas syringae]